MNTRRQILKWKVYACLFMLFAYFTVGTLPGKAIAETIYKDATTPSGIEPKQDTGNKLVVGSDFVP